MLLQSLFTAHWLQSGWSEPEEEAPLLVVLVGEVVAEPEEAWVALPEPLEEFDPPMVEVRVLLELPATVPEVLPVGEPVLLAPVAWPLEEPAAPVDDEEVVLLPLHAASTARQQHPIQIFSVIAAPGRGPAGRP